MTVEQVKVDYLESRSNVYRVPLKQWRKWGPGARQVFNEVYSSMTRGQDLFLHPKQEKMSRSHWRTTAWNAAWTAASAAQGVA
jgi:hypothetical protein